MGFKEQIREGSRGGHDQFSWDKIKSDKYRQNYLGNSINVPHDRSGRDMFWYTKTNDGNDKSKELNEEMKILREKEADLMGKVL